MYLKRSKPGIAQTVFSGLVLIILLSGCEGTPTRSTDAPFYTGFETLPWGSTIERLDSLVTQDTAWLKISFLNNPAGKGITCVIRKKDQDYLLDYNAMNQFYAFNYIREQDAAGSLDTLVQHLNNHYGPAETTQPQTSYKKNIWTVDHPACSLIIQIIITDQRYAVYVRNQTLAE